MKKLTRCLLMMSLMVGIVLGADVPTEKKTQFALTLSGLAVAPDTGHTRGTIGPGARLDLNLGRSIMIAPEITVGLTGMYGGVTVNYRIRKFFAGLGGGLLYFYKENQDIQGDGMLKAHVGSKGPHWLFSVAYVSNVLSGGWLKGVQLTAGYIF